MRTIFMVLDLPQLISFSSCLPTCFLPYNPLLETIRQPSFSWLPFQLCTLWHIYTITFDAQLLHSHLQQLAPCSRVTEASKPPSWNSV
ncbi:unnamed protein product [Fusarium graminearum]|uniref:Chromosome 1, complete genome n=1 Tax=Gibberella zeae (strain ATCC MYA-4620 / CBS 123657 / FGSC 9075 / NRRL 31084 / PH-1) TaxID=229533 RepID=A0A1C3YID7_GIBZE|nr:unnamed protein product [Fusarium graminearum]